MNDKSIQKIVKRFMRRRPFKQVKTIEEADLFLIFTPDEIEKITIKLKKRQRNIQPTNQQQNILFQIHETPTLHH